METNLPTTDKKLAFSDDVPVPTTTDDGQNARFGSYTTSKATSPGRQTRRDADAEAMATRAISEMDIYESDDGERKGFSLVLNSIFVTRQRIGQHQQVNAPCHPDTRGEFDETLEDITPGKLSQEKKARGIHWRDKREGGVLESIATISLTHSQGEHQPVPVNSAQVNQYQELLAGDVQSGQITQAMVEAFSKPIQSQHFRNEHWPAIWASIGGDTMKDKALESVCKRAIATDCISHVNDRQRKSLIEALSHQQELETLYRKAKSDYDAKYSSAMGFGLSYLIGYTTKEDIREATKEEYARYKATKEQLNDHTAAIDAMVAPMTQLAATNASLLINLCKRLALAAGPDVMNRNYPSVLAACEELIGQDPQILEKLLLIRAQLRKQDTIMCYRMERLDALDTLIFKALRQRINTGGMNWGDPVLGMCIAATGQDFTPGKLQKWYESELVLRPLEDNT